MDIVVVVVVVGGVGVEVGGRRSYALLGISVRGGAGSVRGHRTSLRPATACPTV